MNLLQKAIENREVELADMSSQRDNDMALAHMPFSPKENNEELAHLSPSTSERAGVRLFSLGSEWLYYKLYCGVKTADKLLADVIRPLVDELIGLEWIDNFFFIRYADPDLHIRVRFHLADSTKLGHIITKISTYLHPYADQGLITKTQQIRIDASWNGMALIP